MTKAFSDKQIEISKKNVDYILNQIVKKLIAYIEKKKKVKVRGASIKEQLMLFVNCVIENPSFDSQTKERLITPKSKFGSKPELSSKFLKTICDSGLTQKVLQFADFKENTLMKKTNGKKF